MFILLRYEYLFKSIYPRPIHDYIIYCTNKLLIDRIMIIVFLRNTTYNQKTLFYFNISLSYMFKCKNNTAIVTKYSYI